MSASQPAALERDARPVLWASTVLDAPERPDESEPWIAGAGAVLVHICLALAAALATSSPVPSRVARVTSGALIEIAPPPPPPPPPAAEEAPPPPAAAPKAVRAPARARPAPAAAQPETPPAPAAAEAGKVLAAEGEVVDFSNTIVSGTGSSYAGGTTARDGTSRAPASEPSARGAGSAAAIVDRSRAPQLAEGASWDCPFPEEADDLGIDTGTALLRVEVTPDGGVRSVTVAQASNGGFAREAKRCALAKRWTPGRDRAGQPAMATALVNVSFQR